MWTIQSAVASGVCSTFWFDIVSLEGVLPYHFKRCEPQPTGSLNGNSINRIRAQKSFDCLDASNALRAPLADCFFAKVNVWGKLRLTQRYYRFKSTQSRPPLVLSALLARRTAGFAARAVGFQKTRSIQSKGILLISGPNGRGMYFCEDGINPFAEVRAACLGFVTGSANLVGFANSSHGS